MNLPLAPLIAVVAGGAAALGVAAVPVSTLEALVMDSGLPAIISAAEPPLGLTARAAVVLGTGGLVAAFVWLSAFILLGTRGLTIGRDDTAIPDEEVATPVIRRADAHPDAPPRPPLLATRDLGTPFLEVRARKSEPVAVADEEHIDFDSIFPPRSAAARPAEVEPVRSEDAPSVASVEEAKPATAPVRPAEQELPADFDQPLSAFDPEAIPAVPRSAPVPVAPLRRTPRPAVFEESERFEIFELTPPVRRRPSAQSAPMAGAGEDAIVRPETDASIHALLERLERGVVTKGLDKAPPRTRESERGLEDALVTLRNLARRTA